MPIKRELNELRELIERRSADKNVKVVYAEKQEWLLLKTADRGKTFGAIRFNKNSYVTLYLDTKEFYNMSVLIHLDSMYQGMQADIQSSLKGNFIQNKFKFYNEEQKDYIPTLINKVVSEDGIHVTKKVRQKKTIA